MSRETGVRWLYKLESDYTWDAHRRIPNDLVFRDRGGKVRMIIENNGLITILRGYSWNGCSPKFTFFDLLLGTPEGVVHVRTGKPKTYYASMIHDALYQFLSSDLPLDRSDADAIFKALLRESDFSLAWMYWSAVRLFGWFVRRATAIKRHWVGSMLVVEEFPEGGTDEPGAA